MQPAIRNLFFKVFTLLLFCSLLAVVSCSDAPHQNAESEKDHEQGAEKSTALSTPGKDARSVLGALVAHYLHIKDGLVKNDSRYAADGANALLSDLKHLDKSHFTEAEKGIFERVEEGIIDLAGHVANNPKNIVHQREHLSKLGYNFYFLVNSFGYKGPLYAWKCAHKDDEEGLLWLTEDKNDPDKNISPFTGKVEAQCAQTPESIGK